MYIGQGVPRQVVHDLMHVHHDLVNPLLLEGHWVHVWADLAPLLRPVGAHAFVALHEAALERPRPLHVRGHVGEGSVDVARVEGFVRGAESFDLQVG